MKTTSDGSIKVNDVVLLTGGSETAKQGVVTAIESDRIVLMQTTSGIRRVYVSGLSLVSRPKPAPCGSCGSDMRLRNGTHWVCPYCQGEPGSIKRTT